MSTRPPTPEEFRRAVGQFATGVTVVTVEDTTSSGAAPRSQVHGMTANSFASVSLEPLLVLICVEQQAKLLPLLQKRRRFGISVLSAEQQDLSRYFSRSEKSPETEERLGIRYRWTENGIPLLEGTIAQIACQVVATHVAGDHTIFVAEVQSAEIQGGEPLLFCRGKYRRLAPES